MSEFNGKKFYGYSLCNDPALSTTTRNFEFQYARREQLDRVIEEVQSNENPLTKQRKNMLAKFSNVKKSAKPQKEVSSPFQTKDVDVETRLSSQDTRKMRTLTDNEIDTLISKAKHKFENANANYINHIVNETTNMSAAELDKLIVCASENTKDIADAKTKSESLESDNAVFESSIVDDLRAEQPKWVEIVEKSDTVPVFYEEIMQPMSPLMQQDGLVELLPPPDQNQNDAISNYDESVYDPMMMQYPCNIYHNQSYYEVIDSDLEEEMKSRDEYTKYISDRPDLGNLKNLNDELDSVGKFIEIESTANGAGMSFLKSTIPMRYTDLTDELPEDNPTIKVIMNNISKDDGQGDNKSKISTTENPSKSSEHKKKKPKAVKKRVSATSHHNKETKPHKEQIQSPPNTIRPSTNTSTKPKQAQQHETESAKVTKQNSYYSYSSAPSSRISTPRSKQKTVHTKSLAELKVEKMTIYSNMAATQERIIETIDKLSYSLLEIHLPESAYDTAKRQKNAFEFSVRFSRNYLFPLKGMIEDLKSTTIAQVNSALTNDACSRVASIYTLILHSLNIYQKQLRYFVLDQVPQKLTTLVELMQMATNVCLEKHIFDLNDPLIDCMRDRCSKFIGFLEDMHDQRFLAAQTNYKQLNLEKLQPPRYDLKMFMNNLNMYEPKLVPKKNSRRGHTAKASKNQIDIDIDESDMPYSRRTMAEDGISTHMQNTKLRDSSGLLSDWQSLISKSTNAFLSSNKTSEQLVNSGLNKAIVDALQTVTKEQVRQVMQPIIQSLGNALEMKKNSEMIEAILNAFNTNLLCRSSTVPTNDNKRCTHQANAAQLLAVRDNDAHHMNSTTAREQQQQPQQRERKCERKCEHEYEHEHEHEQQPLASNASKSLKATKQTKQMPSQRARRKAGKIATATPATTTATQQTPTPIATPTPAPPQRSVHCDREVVAVARAANAQRVDYDYHHDHDHHDDDDDDDDNNAIDDNEVANVVNVVDDDDDNDNDVDDAAHDAGKTRTYAEVKKRYNNIIAIDANANGDGNGDAGRTAHAADDVNDVCDGDDGDYDDANAVVGVRALGVEQRASGGGFGGGCDGVVLLQQQRNACYHNSGRLALHAGADRAAVNAIDSVAQQAPNEYNDKRNRNDEQHNHNDQDDDHDDDVDDHDNSDDDDVDYNDVDDAVYANNFRVSIVNVKQKAQQQQHPQQQQQHPKHQHQQQRPTKETAKPTTKRTKHGTKSEPQREPPQTRPSQTKTKLQSNAMPPTATNATTAHTHTTLTTHTTRSERRSTTATSVKRSLYGKKRAHVLTQPTPPAPAGTPITSARSYRRLNTLEQIVVNVSGGDGQQQQPPQQSHKHDRKRPPSARSSQSFGAVAAAAVAGDEPPVPLSMPIVYNFNSCRESTQQMLQSVRERSYRGSCGQQQQQQQCNGEWRLGDVTPLTAVQLLQDAGVATSATNSSTTTNTDVISVRSVKNNSNNNRNNNNNNRHGHHTERSILEQTSQTQLQKLKSLQTSIKQQQRKQQKQMRTLDKLNTSATQLYGSSAATARRDRAGVAATECNASQVDNMLRERNKFIESCRQNRFYANPNYEEPWRVFSKLSEQLANEIVGKMEQDFTTGVSKFVQDFLDVETKT